jgi:hypothetical protein
MKRCLSSVPSEVIKIIPPDSLGLSICVFACENLRTAEWNLIKFDIEEW